MTAYQSRALQETRAFLAPMLAGRRRVLDVGCGHGVLAAALAQAGHDVTAIDLALPPDRATAQGLRYEESGLLAFEAPPFDAILFVTSLHHITPLPEAVAHARRLLVPGGLLVAEEFAVEAPDVATAHWYFETQELLAAADLYPRTRLHGDSSQEPLERWRQEHAHEGEPLSEGRAMKEELGRQLELLEAREGAYLYRYLAAGLAEHLGEGASRTAALVDHLFAAEQRGIAFGALRAVGLRMVARRSR